MTVVDQTSQDTSPGRLEVPSHGHGRLKRGNPGNKGGGNTPDEIRALMRGELVQTGLPKLLRKYKRGKLDDVAVCNFLARYGLGQEQVTAVSPEVVDRVQRQVQLIASQPTWDSQELIRRLGEEVWK